MGSSEKLTVDDLEVIRDTSGIKRATGMGYSFAKFEFNDLIHYGFVSGISPDPDDMALVGEAQTWNILKGRNLESGDKYKVVLGYEHSLSDLFEESVDVGDKMTIHGQDFRVVGFLEKIGSPPDDQSAIMPLEAYEEVFDEEDELGFIIAQSQAGEDPVKVAEKVEKDLRTDHGLEEGEEDFSVETMEQFMATFNVILNIVQIVLIGIASIALLVGGIGIMNTMYTSVLQRTKDIGVMKALGAKNSHIMFLFLVESGLYGLGGGIIGALMGIGFAKLVEFAFIYSVGPAFLLIEINPWFVFGVLLFSFIVGAISGIAPAWRASKLKPVDSLRYE